MLLDIKGYNNDGLDLTEEKGKASAPDSTMNDNNGTPDLPNNNDSDGKIGNRPFFKIALPTSDGSYGIKDKDIGNGNPTDIVIGLHGSNSTQKLQINGMRSRDSRESLIPEDHSERWYSIAAQVTIPLLLAGLGMVGAGIILNDVKEWEVFQSVPEFLVLVTPLLGLKGNLEMTLASRLSTQSNLGNMDTFRNQWYICCGNLALTQVQAIVVGCLASVVAMSLGVAFDGVFMFERALLLCASSILTASIASCLLGILMVAVIILCNKFNLNPDNIATPVAASLGDVTTLILLSNFASILYSHLDSLPWLSPCVIVAYFVITPLGVVVSYKNSYTKKILYTGWAPVMCAMVISSGGGLLLDMAEKFPRMALFQPVINGVGGNLVSVQASRISTALHKHCEPGNLPAIETKSADGSGTGTVGVWLSPWNVFTKQGVHSVSARVLLAIVAPGHVIFCFTSFAISGQTDMSQLSLEFFAVYLTAALVQVAILLYIAQIMTHWFWIRKMDPDTSTIPYLTALGDLMGSGFLVLAFLVLEREMK